MLHLKDKGESIGKNLCRNQLKEESMRLLLLIEEIWIAIPINTKGKEIYTGKFVS